MTVSEVNIEEFRGIKKCKKPIKLSKFNVLVGRNNSGKSSILEALYLLPTPDSYNIPYNMNKLQMISEVHSGANAMVYGYTGEAHLKYIVNDYDWGITITTEGGGYKLNNQDPKLINYDEELAIETVFGKKYMKLKDRGNFSFLIVNNTRFLDKLENVSKRDKQIMMKKGAHIKATKLINDYIDDDYTEILLMDTLQARKELDDNIHYISLKDLGDGIEKAISTILWIEALEPELLLWDDFEATAHPSLIYALLKYLINKRTQVVLSTHNIDILYELSEIKPKDATILQIRKTKNDILDYNSLSMDELGDLLDASIDPRLLIENK